MPYTHTRISNAIDSPRHLALRHARKVIALNALAGLDAAEPEIARLSPGEEQLYSFYAPGLEAGLHTITAVQTIKTKDGSQVLNPPPTSVQKFEVVAPRFTLPKGSIHSIFPPPGDGAPIETLPHVVLNDPHLPWERIGTEDKNIPPEQASRNRVPWLAVLVFTQDELRLSKEEMGRIFEKTSISKTAKQSTTLSINMSVADVRATQDCDTPIATRPEDKGDATVDASTTDTIFVKSKLFDHLVAKYNNDGMRDTQTAPDVSRYKYLVHVRDINTTGMAEAGVEDDGVFSVVVSHRVGPMDIAAPTPVVVHLVSLESVEQMTYPFKTSYIALSSLNSWTYNCLPPNTLNVKDAFCQLGITREMLRAPKELIDNLNQNEKPENARIVKRLQDGYTLTRHRVQTGESTVAFTRGPLTPTVVEYPLTKDWTGLSTCGTDLQILDKEVGIMDITYSMAWQLGKAMALADQAFTASLSRLRTYIHSRAVNDSKAHHLSAAGAYKTHGETVGSLVDSLRALAELPSSGGLVRPGGLIHRWKRPFAPEMSLDLRNNSHLIDSVFEEKVASVIKDVAGASDGWHYDETNTPNSPDWMHVLQWVVDRMYLINVPAHYLITDPSHLPEEGLRFFHIDHNWVDALIDGALSIANHMEEDDDRVRIAIKDGINTYLDTVNPKLGYKPPVPTYGFLMRSQLVSRFPDMVITPTYDASHKSPPILRHENIDAGVMLCLFDQMPREGVGLQSLTIREPPHQQSFAVGDMLTAKSLETLYKRIWMIPHTPSDTDYEPFKAPHPATPDSRPRLFVWDEDNKSMDVRTLVFPAWADNVFNTIKVNMNKVHEGSFTDDMPTSGLIGIQLNDPIWQLEILLKQRDPVPESSATRTLNLLRPRNRTVAKMIGKPMRIAAAAPVFEHTLPKFGMRTRLPGQPGNLRHPSPHFATLNTNPTTPPWVPSFSHASRTGLKDDKPPAWAPYFHYDVYPASGMQISTTSGIPQDLIFSIYRDPKQAIGQFFIQELQFQIPIGIPPADDSDENGPTLTETYSGPGTTMLSNLRFNCLLEFPSNKEGDGKIMLVRLLPRSTAGKVHIRFCTEMSFSLAMVHLWPYPVEAGEKVVTVNIEEKYEKVAIQKHHVRIVLNPEED